MDSPVTSDAEQLRRWLAAGGECRVVSRSEVGITLALLTCDGGEEMDRIVSTDPDLLDRVDSTRS